MIVTRVGPPGPKRRLSTFGDTTGKSVPFRISRQGNGTPRPSPLSPGFPLLALITMSNTPPEKIRVPEARAEQQASPLATSPDRRVPPRRSPLRRFAAVLAAVLALFGLGTLGAVLLLSLGSQAVAPWLVAASLYALPLASLLMAGLMIDGIRRRRRG